MSFLHMLLVEGKNPFKGNQISLEDAAKFVAKECRHSLKSTPIYTNGVGRFDAFMVQPGQRKPQGVLEVLVDDVLEGWSSYPNRTQSLVGSGHPGKFRVFPVDGANVGYTNKPSFGEGFGHIEDQFGDLDVAMRNLMQITSDAYNSRMGDKKSHTVPDQMSGGHMKDFFRMSNDLWGSSKNRNINRIASSAGADDKTRDHLSSILELGERDFGKGLEAAFNPSYTDMKASSINEMPQGVGEVWTDAPAVLVRVDKLGNM